MVLDLPGFLETGVLSTCFLVVSISFVCLFVFLVVMLVCLEGGFCVVTLEAKRDKRRRNRCCMLWFRV